MIRAGVLVAALMLSACGDNTVEQLTAVDVDTVDGQLQAKAVVVGQKLFVQYCAGCHGAADQPRAPSAPDLLDDYWLIGGEDLETFKIRASDIEKRIRFGIRATHDATWKEAVMPAKGGGGDLTPLEIDHVAEYVLELAGAANVDMDVAMRGEVIYRGKGGCFDCHGMKGEGASAFGATALNRPGVWLYGTAREAVAGVTGSGAAGVSPAFEGKLSPGEIKAIALYVRSSAKGLSF